jgi:ribosome maturation protein Sdo1
MYENKRCDRCVAWIETTCINPNTKKVEKSANIKKALFLQGFFY